MVGQERMNPSQYPAQVPARRADTQPERGSKVIRRSFTQALGFTLIELLVVLAIIGTLLSIAAPRYTGSVDKSNLAVLQQNLSAMRESMDKMYGDTGRYPQSLDELVTQKYLRRIPVDPMTGSSTTWILEQSTDSNVPGIVDVHSGAPGKTRQGQAYKSL